MDANTGPQRGAIPILRGVLPVERSRVPAEILAGITLAALAIPEVMGYTKIAGTPLITGLYTMLLPMIIYSLFGASRHLVVGADSATAAIMAGGIAAMAVPGSPRWLALAGALAMMAAALLLVARLVRLGFLANFLSRTVLVGFLTGVGIQVATGEIGSMVGLSPEGVGTLPRLLATLRQGRAASPGETALSAAMIITILGARKISRKIPGALIAVTGAILVSWAFDLEGRGVRTIGAVPGGLPRPGLPGISWSLELIHALLPTAFAMAVVIMAQSGATSLAYANRYDEPSTKGSTWWDWRWLTWGQV